MLWTRVEQQILDGYRTVKSANESYMSRLLTGEDADYSWELLQAKGRVAITRQLTRKDDMDSAMHMYKLLGIAIASLLFFIWGWQVLLNVGTILIIAFFEYLAYHFGLAGKLAIAIMIVSTIIGMVNSYNEYVASWII